MNFVNVSVQNDPSTTSQCKMPSRRDNAGRTEKRRPRTKNALRCAFVPLNDHARPRYVVLRSTELSSTEIIKAFLC